MADAAPGTASTAAGPAVAGVAHAAPPSILPVPSSALSAARTQLLDGDYPRAIAALIAIQAIYPGTAEAAEALFHQAEAHLADDQFAIAEDHLRRFLALYPEHPRRATASLMLGRALEARGEGGAAIQAYKQYEAWADSGASLADFIHLRAAQIYFAANQPEDGWAELGLAAAASASSPSASMRVHLYDDLALRYWNSGDRANAAAARAAALEASIAANRPASQIAAAAWRLTAALHEAGDRISAGAMRWRIVGEWPRTSQALQAMNEIGAGFVPAYQKGLIYYSNSRWRQAADVFTGYINSGAPDGYLAEARYYRAVALTRLGDDEALAALDRVYEHHPDTPWADRALWEAGNLLLRRGDQPAAAARFEQLAVGYPNSEFRSQALYWLGKLLPQLGNSAAGQRYMQAAAVSGYENFFTFRARAALRQPPPAPRALHGQEAITETERSAWFAWLAAHGYAPEAQQEKRASVEADARFHRGTALLEAGFRKEAEEEFLEIVRAAGHDPVVVEHIAVHVRERGFYPLSVTLGHRLLDTVRGAGELSILGAPRVVQKLILPLAFLGLVEPAARAKGLDPLLLLGLMKQESWFEPRAASWAQARGLTQFIRETATHVARELSWPNWTWDDMNRPYVSVPFGAHYLSSLIREFRGNYHFALAGYNGGPGNVLRWAKGDWNRDLDLFVEEIAFAETRGYVKSVAANYELYKAIYYR